jgi:DNA-binding response OmpR family regulator
MQPLSNVAVRLGAAVLLTLPLTATAQLRRPNRRMPSDRAIDSYVCRLRARLCEAGGPGLTASVHSVGYRLDGNALRT